jgi:hypothetical protein
VGLGLLGALAWYFFGGQPADEEKPVPVAPPVVRKEVPKPVAEPVVPKVDLAALPDPTKIGTDLTGIYTSLTDLLGEIKDVPTAEAAVTKLTDLTPKIDGLQALWDKVPDAGRATVAKVTTDHLGKLKDLVAKVLAIPGVSGKLEPVLDTVLAKLSAFSVS